MWCSMQEPDYTADRDEDSNRKLHRQLHLPLSLPECLNKKCLVLRIAMEERFIDKLNINTSRLGYRNA